MFYLPLLTNSPANLIPRQIPGQLKLRLERMPLSMYKRAAPNPTTPYRLLKKSEVLGYTAGYTDSAKNCWWVLFWFTCILYSVLIDTH